MTKTTIDEVILCFTKAEATWAIQYALANKHKKIKFVTPSLEAQTELRDNHFPPYDYFSLGITTANFYQGEFKKLILQSYKLTKKIQAELNGNLVSFQTPVIKSLQVILEAEIYNVLYCFLEFQQMEKKWRPQKYLISIKEKLTLNNWSSIYFSLPSLVSNFFAEKNKIEYYHAEKEQTVNSPHLNYLKYLYQVIKSPKKIKTLSYTLFKRMNRKSFRENVIKKPDFILFSSGFNLYYYHRLFEVIKNDNLSVKGLVIAGHQTLEQEYYLHKAKIDFIPIEQFTDNLLEKKISHEIELINGQISSAIKKISRAKLDSTLSKKTREAIISKLSLILKKYSCRCIRQAAIAKKIINTTKPHLVITTHDPGLSSIPLVSSAHQSNIPTLVLIHGWQECIYAIDHISRYAAIWGPETQHWYENSLHKNKKTIYPIGFPFFDDWIRQKKAFWQTSKSIPKIGNHIKIGILLSLYQGNTFGWTKFVDELLSELSIDKNSYYLSIRTHSGQSLKGIEKLAQLYNFSLNINPPGDLDEFIKKQDIILSWDTTAFLWAMLYGKPLFCTTQYWGPGLSPVKKYGAAWQPENALDLVNKINQIKKNPRYILNLRKGQKNFLENVLGKLDGNSAERLHKLIKYLVQ